MDDIKDRGEAIRCARSEDQTHDMLDQEPRQGPSASISQSVKASEESRASTSMKALSSMRIGVHVESSRTEERSSEMVTAREWLNQVNGKAVKMVL
ncbi:hypothetical protein JR316_0007606 [Psilocybe cubensis]|uniref:Uncharacterized protein n=1 Tax=Psilocybe cubensis TaxID=181762 RepID=A0ACB8GUC1_PSICU|nr:hypothetical protein JR316_0007606 [Psilocybe cubensis]KAH9479032.1 hypothetical protein JR316_0007606 [Psilocybe cubensis]